MMNVLAMARVGGFIYHTNPFNMANHGFFNLNPTFYNDFYADNGHRLAAPVRLVWRKPDRTYGIAEPSATGRFDFTERNVSTIVVAQKLNDRPPKWPMQTKYKKNPSLKG
jgi:hypothetical protein